jgi:hypothetical protein
MQLIVGDLASAVPKFADNVTTTTAVSSVLLEQVSDWSLILSARWVMPKLLFLLACEKSIIEKDTQQVSMIGLVNSFTIAPLNKPPENAVIPQEWSVVSGWAPSPEDAGKEFTQMLNIVLANGKPFVHEVKMTYAFQQGMRYHIATKIRGIPVGVPGIFTVEVWTELAGKQVTEKSQLLLEIIHSIPSQGPEPANKW